MASVQGPLLFVPTKTGGSTEPQNESLSQFCREMENTLVRVRENGEKVTQRRQSSTRDRGRKAEQVAVDFLIGRDYHIIERNFTCKLGEIDIIAEHKGEVVFVEVRSSRPGSFIDPAYSINRTKQRKIIRAARMYLAERFHEAPPCRFDVVLVRAGQHPDIELIPSAFEDERGCTGI